VDIVNRLGILKQHNFSETGFVFVLSGEIGRHLHIQPANLVCKCFAQASSLSELRSATCAEGPEDLVCCLFSFADFISLLYTALAASGCCVAFRVSISIYFDGLIFIFLLCSRSKSSWVFAHFVSQILYCHPLTKLGPRIITHTHIHKHLADVGGPVILIMSF
jgi:hypothetical protein